MKEVFDTRKMIKENTYDNYLYHYTSLETGIEHILDKSEIRFSPFAKVNDPLEYKHQVTYIYTHDNDIDSGKMEEFEQKLKHRIMNEYKVLCFSQDRGAPCEEIKNSVYQDLIRGYAKPRMWAQYGQNHRGICLVFDKDLLIEEIKETLNINIIYKSIEYNDCLIDMSNDPYCIDYKNMCVTEEYIDDHVTEYPEIVFSKAKDWEGENEFRIIALDNDVEYLKVRFRKSLKGIVLGAEFPLTYMKCINHFTNIDIGQIKWSKDGISIKQV